MIAYSNRNDSTDTGPGVTTSTTAGRSVSGTTVIAPREIFVYAETRAYPLQSDFEEWIKEIKILTNIHECQWILRFRFRFDMPNSPKKESRPGYSSGFV